jgi:hypothetical protein
MPSGPDDGACFLRVALVRDALIRRELVGEWHRPRPVPALRRRLRSVQRVVSVLPRGVEFRHQMLVEGLEDIHRPTAFRRGVIGNVRTSGEL